MAVDAVQNNKMSYVGAMTLGALGGYSLKWAIPLTSEEKNDEKYSSELSAIKIKAKKARNEEIEAIKKDSSNIPYGDTFIKMSENNELEPSIINKFEGTKQEALMNLLERVDDAGKMVKHQYLKELTVKTKSLRSTGTFVSLGFLAGVLVSAIHKVATTPLES